MYVLIGYIRLSRTVYCNGSNTKGVNVENASIFRRKLCLVRLPQRPLQNGTKPEISPHYHTLILASIISKRITEHCLIHQSIRFDHLINK